MNYTQSYSERPKIKPPVTVTDRIIESVTIGLLILLTVVTAVMFFKLPETIPVHFNLQGEVDNYGNRVLILIIPVIAWVFYGGLTWLTRYPHIYNYGGMKITAENAPELYAGGVRLISIVKAFCAFILCLVQIIFVYVAVSGDVRKVKWLLPVILILSLILAIYSVRSAFRTKANRNNQHVI
jgi:uncharacterized membrane protein